MQSSWMDTVCKRYWLCRSHLCCVGAIASIPKTIVVVIIAKRFASSCWIWCQVRPWRLWGSGWSFSLGHPCLAAFAILFDRHFLPICLRWDHWFHGDVPPNAGVLVSSRWIRGSCRIPKSLLPQRFLRWTATFKWVRPRRPVASVPSLPHNCFLVVEYKPCSMHRHDFLRRSDDSFVWRNPRCHRYHI